MENKHNDSNRSELISLLLLSIIASGVFYLWQGNETKPQVITAEVSPFPGSTPFARLGARYPEEVFRPEPGEMITNKINIATGFYNPVRIKIRRGETVTWESYDLGQMPNAVESDSSIPDYFSSPDLRAGDKFSHTFNFVGVHTWHDKYNGNLRGTITVVE